MTKMQTARFNDFIYDPLFIVSGAKDYYKAAAVAQMSSAKYAICPNFPSMFSDLPHQPRYQNVMRQPDPIPDYEVRVRAQQDSLSYFQANIDIGGADRHKFFRAPIKILNLDFKLPKPTRSAKPKPVLPAKKKKTKMQTQYRESEAQTIPWEPDYFVADPENGDPELLMLDFLKWGSGLPAGMHEVTLIERARMKRAWEKAMPPITGPESLEKRRKLIEAIERDAWAFRDQEIQDIQDLRLELLEKMLDELLDKSKTRAEMKLKNFCKIKTAEKEAKLKVLRHNTARELRKLNVKQAGLKTKYHYVDVVKAHRDKKSEIYGPMMRHGDHPKRWHQVIDDHYKKYRAQFLTVEEIDTLPRWLDQATKIKASDIKLPGTRLCIRETKWTTPVLKQLHEELKNLRQKEPRKCRLERIEKDESVCETPTMEAMDDWDEEVYQSSLLIQSVLRGRASQMLIFEGRDRCRELIEELRSTHSLQDEDRIIKFKQRLEVKSQQREKTLCLKNIARVQDSLKKLSGTVVGTLLDFLNKELRRLLDERRVHAMCLLFERERNAREAAEAGRRQTEMRRRREHDEMFKQIVKVHQDTVDLFLQDIITEGMDFASVEDATKYVEGVAVKIDEEAYSTMDKLTFNEKEELIASLVHNFLLPEVEKQVVREKIKAKQHNYIVAAHEEIYKNVEHLPKPRELTIEEESQEDLCRESSISCAVPLDLKENFYGADSDSVNTAHNVKVIYTASATEADLVSHACSVMEDLKYKEDKILKSLVPTADDLSAVSTSNLMLGQGTHLNLLDLNISSVTTDALTPPKETTKETTIETTKETTIETTIETIAVASEITEATETTETAEADTEERNG